VQRLFVSQCDYGVEAHGAARGDRASEHGGEGEHKSDTQKRQRIEGLHAD